MPGAVAGVSTASGSDRVFINFRYEAIIRAAAKSVLKSICPGRVLRTGFARDACDSEESTAIPAQRSMPQQADLLVALLPADF